MAASMGHQAALSIGGVSYPFVSENLQKRAVHLERTGIRGTRSHDEDDVREGPYSVAGQIVLEPTINELNTLRTFMYGVGGALNETLASATIIIDRVTAVFTYADCKITRATLSGRQGELYRLALDVVGTTESISGDAPVEPTSAVPVQFSDTTLTLAASPREVQEVELMVDNFLVTDRFQNNTYLAEIPEGDRLVTLRTVHGYSSNTSGLYAQAVGGAAGSLVLYDGQDTATWAFTKLQVPALSPYVPGKGELPLVLDMIARKSGANAEFTFTV